jgi:hypothetical protein
MKINMTMYGLFLVVASETIRYSSKVCSLEKWCWSYIYIIHKMTCGTLLLAKSVDCLFRQTSLHEPVVHSMETNSKKLRTPSSISWSIQIKSRQQVWWVHSTTQNIEYKLYAGDRAPFHKRVKAQKSTPMLIRWQIQLVYASFRSLLIIVYDLLMTLRRYNCVSEYSLISMEMRT